jgi:hypothetical protein
MILRQQQIPFDLVNATTSKTTRQRTLFVIIRNPEPIRTYEPQTQEFFTHTHYNELRTTNQLPRQNIHTYRPQRHKFRPNHCTSASSFNRHQIINKNEENNR